MTVPLLARRGHLKEKTLFSLSLDMTKKEVLNVIGKPAKIKFVQNNEGRIHELHEYFIKGKRTSVQKALIWGGNFILLPFFLYITAPKPTSFYVFFHNGKLVQFGTIKEFMARPENANPKCDSSTPEVLSTVSS